MDTESARLPEGERIYAVGDIHGRRDLLERLLRQIADDIAARPVERPRIVCLGDVVDRGDDTRGVIDLFVDTDRLPAPAIGLMGNHEEMLIRFLEKPEEKGYTWLINGGIETVWSYGIGTTSARRDGAWLRSLRDEFCAALPVEHIGFLDRLEHSLTIGDYFFCHAGARAGVPLNQQEPHDLMWIRRGFADSDRPFEKVVVHGHTAVDAPEVHRHRIAIDTGAYGSDVLTCLVVDAGQTRFLSTGRVTVG